MIIDPNNPYYFDACNDKLQAFLVFGIMVAGKPADRTARLVDQLFDMYGASSPFRKLKYLIDSGRLDSTLRYLKTGKYTLLNKSFRYLVDNYLSVDLNNIPLSHLEQIPGVGMKTSRYFQLYTREAPEGIPLDTHLLSFLNDCGYRDVPSSTPNSSGLYYYFEAELLKLFNQSKFDHLYQFDITIWRAYSQQDQSAKQKLLNLANYVE